jgi:hypothetical protein
MQEWQMANGEWQMANDEKLKGPCANGKWQMMNGSRDDWFVICQLPFAIPDSL